MAAAHGTRPGHLPSAWRVLAGEFAARIFTETGGCDHVEPPDGDSARGNGEKASQEAYDLSMTANRSRKLRLRISALAIPLTILAIACGGDAVDSSDSTAPPAAGSAAEVYSLNCARCHGAQLEGGFGPALDAGSRVGDLEDTELIEIVTEGRNSMPGWGEKLSPEQITDLVALVRESASGG